MNIVKVFDDIKINPIWYLFTYINSGLSMWILDRVWKSMTNWKICRTGRFKTRNLRECKWWVLKKLCANAYSAHTIKTPMHLSPMTPINLNKPEKTTEKKYLLSKIPFFSIVWQRFKVLKYLWQSRSQDILIWGFQKGKTWPCASRGIRVKVCQSLKYFIYYIEIRFSVTSNFGIL